MNMALIKCWFGWHKWVVIGNFANKVIFRKCKVCGKYERKA